MTLEEMLMYSEAAIISAYRVGVGISTIVKMVDDDDISAEAGMELVAEIMHDPNSMASAELCRQVIGPLSLNNALIPARKRFNEKNENPSP